ncbi:hypothetical protein O3P69_006441 [Scylla paramamosain]|uniref:Endonuclease/exonuclease/phosphatase domain-containing protein n=1 Tax=Scylla paramamosain TaxID=85552 RepID=A0AAW0U3G9_SCYPA
MLQGDRHPTGDQDRRQPSQAQSRRRPPPRSAREGDSTREDRGRPRQGTASQRRLQGPSEEQRRRRLNSGYCQGRFNTEETCRERQADRRHQELIEAVRLGSQETIALLRGANWALSPRAIPAGLEVIFHKLVGDRGRGILCVGCYRPPSQGTALIDFLMDNLDRLMTEHQCDNIIILGDLNPPGIQRSFDSLLVVFNLQNHIRFPIHRSGSSLDPVVTDLPSHDVQCSSLGPIGNSDHEAIFSRITFRRPRDESISRTLWQWEKTDWRRLRSCLAQMDWEELLQGDVDLQVEQFTEALLREQDRWVPHQQYKTKTSDLPCKGREVLYKAQIRSALDYSCLA